MFTRRSGRLNAAYSSLQNQNQSPGPSPNPSPVKQNNNPSPTQQTQKQYNEAPQEIHRQRYFNSPEIQNIILNEKTDGPEVKNPVTETPEKDVSATTKALNQVEVEGQEKKKWKKGGKIPTSLRRKKLNRRLSKLLTPKSALILLHEFKPGCVYTVQEVTGCIPASFCAQVEHENVVLGTGQGLSKSQAKHCAAENAIKAIVSRTMMRHSKKGAEAEAEAEAEVETAAAGEAGKGEEAEEDEEDTPENLPWAGLASFAIYKMFTEWHNQGSDFMSMRPAIKAKPKAPNAVNPSKKELPPNAAELHPAVVLNLMNPGLTAVEIEREDGPKCQVKMGYVVEGQMYTGIGGNKKDAKKEAAKAVLQGHYGLTYH